MTTIIFIECLGWIGAISCLLAYFLVSTKRLEGTSFAYQALNMIGGIGLFCNALYYGALPSAAVNIIWLGIAILSIYYYHSRQTPKPQQAKQ